MAYDLTKPSDPSLPPGSARCPGPSTRDLILADGDDPPEALLQEAYEFLGDESIAFDRYTSRGFFERELTHMWTRTWQWVCREEHIPKVGDYIVYDLADYSFIVVRSAPGVIQAFYNSCLHRGMQLLEPGSKGSLKSIRCPFHGMSWRIDGSLRQVPCRWDFPHIRDDSFTLPEVRVDTWGGFVFINLDPEGPALLEFLGVLPEHFQAWPLEERYVEVHTEKLLPANWKMALEAFLEAYHVLATHPEGLMSAGDANAQYDVFDERVTRFIHTIGHPSPHLKRAPSQAQMLKAMSGGMTADGGAAELQPGVTARAVVAERLRKSLGERYDADLSGYSTSELLDSIEYHLFPNMFLFPGISLPMIYRFRPNGTDVDTSIMEILFLAPLPRSRPRPAPAEITKLGIDDSYTTAPGFAPGLAYVYDQDTSNLRRQRDGVKAAFRRGQTLGNYQEARIRRFHQTLDGYLRA